MSVIIIVIVAITTLWSYYAYFSTNDPFKMNNENVNDMIQIIVAVERLYNFVTLRKRIRAIQ